MELESRIEVPRGWGRGKSLFNQQSFCLGEWNSSANEERWWLDDTEFLMPLNFTLKNGFRGTFYVYFATLNMCTHTHTNTCTNTPLGPCSRKHKGAKISDRCGVRRGWIERWVSVVINSVIAAEVRLEWGSGYTALPGTGKARMEAVPHGREWPINEGRGAEINERSVCLTEVESFLGWNT